MFLRPLQCLFCSPALGKRISRIPIKRLVRDIKYFYREQDAFAGILVCHYCCKTVRWCAGDGLYCVK